MSATDMPAVPAPTLLEALIAALVLVVSQTQEMARLYQRVTDLEDQLAGARRSCEDEQRAHADYRATHPPRDNRPRRTRIKTVNGGEAL